MKAYRVICQESREVEHIVHANDEAEARAKFQREGAPAIRVQPMTRRIAEVTEYIRPEEDHANSQP